MSFLIIFIHCITNVSNFLNPNRGGSHKNIPNLIKTENATINPLDKSNKKTVNMLRHMH